MATGKKNEVPVVAKKAVLWLGADGVIYDSDDRPVVFVDSGQRDAELLKRMVESTNALQGYTLDQIRNGEFRGGFNINNSSPVSVQPVNGNGNVIM